MTETTHEPERMKPWPTFVAEQVKANEDERRANLAAAKAAREAETAETADERDDDE